MEVNRVVHGACVDVMKTLPDEVCDLTVTSPPYDAIRLYHGYAFDFDSTAVQLYRITKPGGVVVWVVGDETKNKGRSGTSFRQALRFMETGFKLFDVIIYAKSGTSFPSNSRYTNCFEYMFVLSKGSPKTVNLIRDIPKRWAGSFGRTTQRQKDGSLRKSTAKNCGEGKSGPATGTEYGFRARDNIWTYRNGYGFGHPDKDLAKQHPASFPLELACDHIVSWTNPGDLVFDPMVGSGTTCKAAWGLDRDYIGVDVSEKYCKLSEQRIALVARGEYLDNEDPRGYGVQR